MAATALRALNVVLRQDESDEDLELISSGRFAVQAIRDKQSLLERAPASALVASFCRLLEFLVLLCRCHPGLTGSLAPGHRCEQFMNTEGSAREEHDLSVQRRPAMLPPRGWVCQPPREAQTCASQRARKQACTHVCTPGYPGTRGSECWNPVSLQSIDTTCRISLAAVGQWAPMVVPKFRKRIHGKVLQHACLFSGGMARWHLQAREDNDVGRLDVLGHSV